MKINVVKVSQGRCYYLGHYFNVLGDFGKKRRSFLSLVQNPGFSWLPINHVCLCNWEAYVSLAQTKHEQWIWFNQPWWPCGLSHHVSNSSRDWRLGPSFESRLGHIYMDKFIRSLRHCYNSSPAVCTLWTCSWYPVTVRSIRFNGHGYKLLILVRGSRFHQSKTQMECQKDEDTCKKGKMALNNSVY